MKHTTSFFALSSLLAAGALYACSAPTQTPHNHTWGDPSYAWSEDLTLCTATLYLCAVSEAVVPITPTQADPTKFEERRAFTPAYESTFSLDAGKAVCFLNEGRVVHATIEIIGNGLYGALTVLLQ